MRRLATEHDIEQVYAIYMDRRVVQFLGYDPMSLGEFRAVYQEALAGGSFYVYEHQGKIAGFYKVMRHPGRARHVAYLGTLAVAPEFHGHGVGEPMVGEALGRLKEEGALRVELFVESDNPRAIRFYERFGFQIEGRLRNFYKRADEHHYVDEIVMGLLL